MPALQTCSAVRKQVYKKTSVPVGGFVAASMSQSAQYPVLYIYIDIYIYYYKECKVTQNMKAPSIQGIFAMKGYTALWASLNYADQAAEPTAGADSWSGLNLVAERALGFRVQGTLSTKPSTRNLKPTPSTLYCRDQGGVVEDF